MKDIKPSVIITAIAMEVRRRAGGDCKGLILLK